MFQTLIDGSLINIYYLDELGIKKKKDGDNYLVVWYLTNGSERYEEYTTYEDALDRKETVEKILIEDTGLFLKTENRIVNITHLNDIKRDGNKLQIELINGSVVEEVYESEEEAEQAEEDQKKIIDEAGTSSTLPEADDIKY